MDIQAFRNRDKMKDDAIAQLSSFGFNSQNAGF